MGWQTGISLASHLCDLGSIPGQAKVVHVLGCRSILVLADFLQAFHFPPKSKIAISFCNFILHTLEGSLELIVNALQGVARLSIE